MKPYDPSEKTTISRKKLPHWKQNGCTYFITFRLKDSIPQSKLIDWNQRRILWLNSRGIDPNTPTQCLTEKLTDSQKTEYYQQFTQYYHDLLDSGLGKCELRDPGNSKIVAESLYYFNKTRYNMGDFIVMPNHVHLLVSPLDDWSLSLLLQSWKRRTAREINKRTQSTGNLWQPESYDHIVRNEAQLSRIQKYIADNPKNLRPHEYLHSRTDC